MIDVKKLITGFLILATAAVSSGLILSLINLSTPAAANNVALQPTITGNSSAIGTSAYLPTQEDVQTVIDSMSSDLASSTMIETSTDPKNLTDVLATEFVNGVVSANPNGPSSLDDSGNPVIATPDVNAVASNVAISPVTKNLQIPNWDVEAASIPMSVVATSDATAIYQYGNAVNDIMSGHINAQVQSIVSSGADNASVDDLAYVQSQVKSALGDAASLKVPKPAIAFQKSLIKVLVYQKNMLQLMTVAQTDPVKASLIFQEEGTKFDLAEQDFQTQGQSITNLTLSLKQAPKPQNLFVSLMDNTLGVPKAYALWPVFDPSTWGAIISDNWAAVARELKDQLKSTILQILKNTLIALVQQKVLAWVQGSGAPRFITNWGTTLINAAQTSAINEINKGINNQCNVYPAFAPQLTITLKAFYQPGNPTCANQFAAALGSHSFQQFYNNFSNGGFIAFGASTLPSGNPYGAQFFEAQKTDLAFRNTQAATALQTQTSQGFKGDQICADKSNPGGSSNTCEIPGGGEYVVPAGGQCEAGDKLVSVPNNGLCANGDHPVVTTPAAITAFGISNAQGATTQQLAAANDIAGLLNSVLSSLVMGLSSAAVNAAGQLVNQSLSSMNSSSITGGGSTPAPTPLACNPSSQTIPSPTSGSGPASTSTPAPTSTSPIFVSAIGGTTDANGNWPTYYWKASSGATSTGDSFSTSFSAPGSYTITLTDSVASDTPATCMVTVQP